jgi:hypothetical protein
MEKKVFSFLGPFELLDKQQNLDDFTIHGDCDWLNWLNIDPDISRSLPICNPWCWNIYQQLPYKWPSFVGKYYICSIWVMVVEW